jgi:2-polyprenyl-3-methyl-5-hydroxy-6-metoxy-1,4-benzoquinol methylase
MYIKLDRCPSCDSDNVTNHLIASDYLVSNESFALFKCQACTLLFTNPRPNTERLYEYYQSDNYVSHNASRKSPLDLIYHVVRRITTRQKINLLSTYHPSGNLLDYGSGIGYFVQKAQKYYDSYGVEPNSRALAESQKSNSATLVSSLDQLPTALTYDVITLWHVLEHIHDLNQTFENLLRKLSRHGHLFIALPNHLSADASYFGDDWAGYDVPRHLYHFSPHSFQLYLKKYKLKLIKVLPMYFDSYYVSLLSQHRGTFIKKLATAMKIGYSSNQSAKTSGHYSSQIYIVSK